MDKQTLVKDMKSTVKDGCGFMNITEIARYLHRSRDSVREMLYGVEYFPSGREKGYFIPDVAERIVREKSV